MAFIKFILIIAWWIVALALISIFGWGGLIIWFLISVSVMAIFDNSYS